MIPVLIGSLAAVAVLLAGRRRRVRSVPWHRSPSGRRWPFPTRQPSDDAAVVEDLRRLRSAASSGTSLVQAIEVVARSGGPWAAPAREVVRQFQAGARLGDALDGWADADGGPVVAAVVDALHVTSATGGQITGALDAVLATVDEREALGREVQALASQARASATAVVVLPFVFGIGVALLDSRVWAFYVGSLGGGLCLAVGASLDLVGALWMRRIVRSVR